MNRFEKKVVLITGATSGMGEAMAKAFASEGADVIIVGRSEDKGSAIVADIASKGGKATFIKCDVSSEENIRTLKTRVESEYGRLDVLINNAGILETYALDEITEERINKTFSTNVNSYMIMSELFMDYLEKAQGNIVNIASVTGMKEHTSGRKQYIYGASKAAIIKFSQLLAVNYAGKVRVNVVCPGIIDTPIFTNKDFSRFTDSIPMGYVGQPEDVANTVLFLASNEAKYITGAELTVDGGASLL